MRFSFAALLCITVITVANVPAFCSPVYVHARPHKVKKHKAIKHRAVQS